MATESTTRLVSDETGGQQQTKTRTALEFFSSEMRAKGPQG
jgi:hypothetical protein